MPTYTADNFRPSLVKGFRKDTQELVKVALTAGWTMHPATRGNVTLKSPLKSAAARQSGVIHLTRSSRGHSGPIQQLYRRVMKYGDPLKIAMIDGVMGGQVEPTEKAFQPSDVPALTDLLLEDMADRLPPTDAILFRKLSRQTISMYMDQFSAEGRKFDSITAMVQEIIAEWTKQEAQVVKRTIRLVSAHPYMSHKNKGSETKPGKSYASKTVIEQKWSDGTVNYKCALCPEERDTPMGITAHWKKHTNAGEAKVLSWGDAGHQLVDDPDYTENIGPERPNRKKPELEELDEDPAPIPEPEYNPREDRVEALSEELLKLIDQWDGESATGLAEQLARQSLMWVHEQKGNGVPRDPQTPEEILAAIRNLVDRGEYAKMRQAALEAEETADAALVRAERAEQKNVKLRTDLAAFRDLFSTVGAEDDEGE